MKRVWITVLIASVSLLASGCTYTTVPENANVAVNIADGSVTSQGDNSSTQEVSSNEPTEPSEVPLLTIDREHTLQVNGEDIDIICTYGISGSRKDDYLFLAPSFVQLSVKLKSYNPRYEEDVADDTREHKDTKFYFSKTAPASQLYVILRDCIVDYYSNCGYCKCAYEKYENKIETAKTVAELLDVIDGTDYIKIELY